MRTFHLQRDVDGSGVSGTGHVADGVEFQNGKVAICWNTKYSSIAVYDSVAIVEHVHGHGGNTKIVWDE